MSPTAACTVTHPVIKLAADFCCSIIFCEAVAIYGVIVAIILQTKLEGVTRAEGLYSNNNMAAGYAIFGAGITCGFSNLVCG
jgi:V-type H+-transporting ATPase proteolipid subunit